MNQRFDLLAMLEHMVAMEDRLRQSEERERAMAERIAALERRFAPRSDPSAAEVELLQAIVDQTAGGYDEFKASEMVGEPRLQTILRAALGDREVNAWRLGDWLAKIEKRGEGCGFLVWRIGKQRKSALWKVKRVSNPPNPLSLVPGASDSKKIG